MKYFDEILIALPALAFLSLGVRSTYNGFHGIPFWIIGVSFIIAGICLRRGKRSTLEGGQAVEE